MLKFEEISKGVYLTTTDSQEYWKCNGIIITDVEDSKIILIDCNFNDEEIEEIFEKFGKDLLAYFISHVHVDHVQYVHLYEKYNIPIYCPQPEDEYIRDLKVFMKNNGAIDYGIADLFLLYVSNFTKTKQLKNHIPFASGKIFEYSNVILKTIHLPGHSPGHTGFEIIRKNSTINSHRDVLFITDIGIENFGPWYGFKYCDLGQYRESIDKIEKIYLKGDYILQSSHSEVIKEKNELIFNKARQQLDDAKARLEELLKTNPANVEDLIGKGVYYKKSTLAKMDENVRNLYLFWEAFSVKNLLEEIEK